MEDAMPLGDAGPVLRTMRLGVALLGLALLPAGARAQQPGAEVLTLDSLLAVQISSGAKYAQTSAEAAASVSIITSEDIDRYGYRTLGEALASLPGFYTSYDRNYTYVGSRGFSRPTDYNNRFLVLIDGNTVNEGIWGGALVGTELGVPLRSLERIEVVRGPGSALYGTGAMFGVINLVTKSGAARDGAELGIEGGSYGRRASQVLFGRRFGQVGASVSGFWGGSDGDDLFYPEYASPATDNGIAHALDWERWWGGLGKVEVGGFTLHGRYASRRKGIPTGAYGMAFNRDSAETRDALGFAELKYDHEIDATKHASARAFYNGYWYEGIYPEPDVTTSDGGRNHVVGTEGMMRWDITSAHRLSLGAEVKHNLEARYFAPRSGPIEEELSVPYTVLSAFAETEHQLTRSLAVLGGIRVDGYSTTGTSVTPRGAAILMPARGTTLKLLYGRAFRAPNIYESEVQNADYRRNPDLRAEQGYTLELVWHQRLAPGIAGTLSAFDYQLRDLIDLTADPDGVLVYRNVGNANSTGFEAGLDARFGSTGGAYASYAFQRTVTEGTRERLTNSPAHLAKAGMSFAPARWLRPAVQMRYESGRRTVYGTLTDNYLLTDLHLALAPGAPGGGPLERLELAVRVSNLFDVDYATPGGVEHVQAAIPQDGRSLGMELRYRF
jgi:outer membrane receptor protein involved in Fe transport